MSQVGDSGEMGGRPSTEPARERGGLLAAAARNPVLANLAMAFLLLGGLVALPSIRQEVFPEFELDLVLVQVPYPGASPLEVEQGIGLAVEEAVRGLDGVKEVRTTAAEGMAVVAVELLLGTDARRALADVQAAVSRIASLPADAERPIVSLASTRGEVIGLVIYGNADLHTLRAAADRVRADLLAEPHITAVDVVGLPPLEMHVEVASAALREHGLTLDEIARAIRAGSVELPAGAVRTARGEVLVRTAERRRTAAEIADIVVRARPDGSVLRVGDIATIRDGFTETEQEARYDGEPAVMLTVYRSGDQKPLEIAQTVRRYATEHADRLPAGLRLAIWNDRSEMFESRMELLRRNGLQSLLLVLLVLALFLDGRTSFWVAAGIPVSFAGTLLLMPALDASINMISMFAFILTLGIVVDDAIVVGEAVTAARERGLQGVEAAVAGVREVAVPVVFSVLTTVVAFVPLLFVPGMLGKFFQQIPIVVITVLLLSLFESLFVLPAHLGHSRRAVASASREPWWSWPRVQVSRGLQWVSRTLYSPCVRAAVRRPVLAIACGVAVFVASWGLVTGGRIKQTFFPRIDSDVVRARVTMPVGTPVEATRAVQQRLLRAGLTLSERWGGSSVRRGVFSTVGMTGAGGGGPGGTQRSTGSHLAEVAFLFVPSDRRGFSAREFAMRWREATGEIAGADSVEFDFSTGGPSSKPVDFVLSHPDVGVLQRAARDLAGRMGAIAAVTDVDDGFSPGKEQIDLRLRPEARSVGITQADLARQVRAFFFGVEALREQRGRHEQRVYVRAPREERERLASLEQMVLRTPEGGEIPLAEAAEVRTGRAPTVITRIDGQRSVRVTADVVPGADEQRVVESIQSTLLPGLLAEYPGLRWRPGGQQQARGESMAALGRGFLLAVLAMFAMLAVPLRSYVQPLVVLSAIPFAFVGALWGHLVLGYDLSLMSMMGMVALAGVAVNDSVVLVDAVNRLRADGMNPIDALVQAGQRRLRPIVLTSLTTFFGLMPLILEPSVQARFLIPMAVSLGCGVLACTFSTLLLVPALYRIVQSASDNVTGLVRAWASRLGRTSTAASPGGGRLP
ncbi:MAG: efflux RND transporter permease subunit [Myxococcota bacterium]|nr:efflux RND transporter permease subunit [Myxococcota bacterium]